MARPQRSVCVSTSNDHLCCLRSRAVLYVLAVITILFAPTQSVAQIITAVSGDIVNINMGSRDGMRVGMTGRITKQEMVAGQLQSFEIARFEVTQVEASSCAARLTAVGSGWVVEPGMEVAFDQPLAPPRVNTATVVIRSNVAGDVAYLDGRRLGPTPQRVEVAPGEHTVRVEKEGYETAEERARITEGQRVEVHAQLTPETPQLPTDPVVLLHEATTAWDRQDWERAAVLYGELLQQAPDNPIAKARRAEAQKKTDEARWAREAAEGQALAEQRRREEELRNQRAEDARRQQELVNVPLWRETVKMLLESGDRAQAAVYLAKISHVAPEDPYLQSVISSEVRAAEKLLEAEKHDEVRGIARWLAKAGAESDAARLREDATKGRTRIYCSGTVPTAELPLVPTDRKPNILVLWGDSVTFPEEGPPPSISDLIKRGLSLCAHQGGANSVAGRGAFVTGLLPESSGLKDEPEMPSGAKTAMEGLSFATIAALLKEQGYATGHFGPSRLGDRDEALPTAHGFDEFFGNLYEMSFEMGPEDPGYPADRDYFSKYGPRGVIHSIADRRIGDTGPLTKKRMETVEQETALWAINFIQRSVASGKPFFVWWNSIRLGDKVIVGDTPDGGIEVEVAILDQHLRIEKILASINEMGVSDSTIVVYSSDDLPGGGEVPAVISWPGVLESNSSWDGRTGHEDWLPSLLTAAGRPNIVEELAAGLKLGRKTFRVELDGTSFFGVRPLMRPGR